MTRRRLAIIVAVAVTGFALRSRADQALLRLSEFCGRAAAHRGVPVAVGQAQARAAYTVSLWAAPDVGTGLLYVVVVPRDGVPFVPPRDVRLIVQSEAGDEPARQYHAYPERVRHGARFVTTVALPRVATWKARVVIDGAAGPDDLRVTFASVAPASVGLATMLLSATPFVLVAGLWGPWRAKRRRIGVSTRLTTARSA